MVKENKKMYYNCEEEEKPIKVWMAGRKDFLCPLSFVRHTRTTPLKSETGWTEELWSKRVLLILEN